MRRTLKQRLLNMQTLRRVVQVASLGLFLALFGLTIGKSTTSGRLVPMTGLPVDLFFKIDPLVGLTAMVAARKIILGLFFYVVPIVLLTVIAGRFFCGWICPMGATLDATDAVFYRSRKRSAGKSQAYRNLKYYFLFAVLVTALCSAQAAYLLDPMAILTRTLTFIVYAPLHLLARTIGNTSFGYDHLPWVASNGMFYGDHQTVFRMGILFFAIFAGIIAAESISRRFWCRNLCPLGALLGLVSRVSVIKRLVGSTCKDCGRCQRECKMAAICDDARKYVPSECVNCYSCTKSCPTDAVRIAPSGGIRRQGAGIDLNRRRTLQALGIGVMWAALLKTDWAGKTIRETGVKASSPQRLRPPGALPEEEFLARCARCSECMKVCPTNGLQPALAEAGIEGLWTPILVPKIGECSQNCNLCSKVCPTGAIQPFEIDEKPHIYIGTAVVDRSACMVWKDGKTCLACDEYCSYHALHWKEIDGIRRPFVSEKKCVGCGMCESACPIQPQAAIRVFSFGDKRNMSRDEQREWGRS